MVLFNPYLEGDKEVHIFPKGISPKGNIIAWLEFELAFYDVEDQHVSHFTVESPLKLFVFDVTVRKKKNPTIFYQITTQKM